MLYFDWRRAELIHWLKWVPVVEQLELLAPGVHRCDLGVDKSPGASYLDKTVSVSALVEERRPLWLEG